MSRPHERTFGQAVMSFAGAVGIVLLVPLGILLVGAPIALAARGISEIIQWLLAAAR